MVLVFQLYAIYLGLIAGFVGSLIFTVASLTLTIVGMSRHGDIRRFKEALPKYNSQKYFWLNLTWFVIITGAPLFAMYFLGPFFVNFVDLKVAASIANFLLNVPGVIYYFQTRSFFPKSKFKWKLPRYL